MLGILRLSRLIKKHTTNAMTLAAMRKSGDPLVEALANAFARTLSGELGEAEKSAIARI